MHQGNNRRNQCGNQDQHPVQKSTKRFNHRNLLGDESARPWLEPSIIEPPMLIRHERRECGHDHQPSTFFTRGKQTRAVRCMSSCAPVGEAVEYRPLYRKAWPKPHRQKPSGYQDCSSVDRYRFCETAGTAVEIGAQRFSLINPSIQQLTVIRADSA
jgi:hypothetical protein